MTDTLERLKPFSLQQPDATATSILEVDFASHVAEGRTNVFLDAEGTILAYDGLHVPRVIQDKLEEARDLGVQRLIIDTNKKPRNEDEFWQLQSWADDIAADLTLVPLSRAHRKGSPFMLLQGMQHFGLTPDECVQFGDKYSDVVAANFAGMHSVYMRRRLERPDHPGDRFIKRPYERALWVMGIVKVREEPLVVPSYLRNGGGEAMAAQAVAGPGFELPAVYGEISRIAGVGTPPIVLKEDYAAVLPPPRFRAAHDMLSSGKNIVYPPKLQRYVYENGGELADKVTRGRRRLGIGSAAVFASGEVLEKTFLKDHKKVTRVLKVAGLVGSMLSDAGDVLDGFLAKHSKDDPTSQARLEGGDEDQKADKKKGRADAIALIISGRKHVLFAALEEMRERHRNKIQRPAYQATGHDTRATFSSKFSSLTQVAANTLAKTGISRKSSNVLHASVVAAKVTSSIASPMAWRHNKAKTELAEAMRQKYAVGPPEDEAA